MIFREIYLGYMRCLTVLDMVAWARKTRDSMEKKNAAE